MHEETRNDIRQAIVDQRARWNDANGEVVTLATAMMIAAAEQLLDESERKLPTGYGRVALMGHHVVVGAVEALPGRGYRVRYKDEEGSERVVDAYALHSVEWMTAEEFAEHEKRRMVHRGPSGYQVHRRDIDDVDDDHPHNCSCNDCADEAEIPSDATAEAPAAETSERLAGDLWDMPAEQPSSSDVAAAMAQEFQGPGHFIHDPEEVAVPKRMAGSHQLTLLRQLLTDARSNLEGWAEPNGHLVPSEPDLEERARIRISLRGLITGYMIALGEEPPRSQFEKDDLRDRLRIAEAAVADQEAAARG